MTDPESLATLDVLNRLSSPAQFTDLNLYTLAACRMLSLTLDRGNSDASAVAYSRLGMVAGLWFGEYGRATVLDNSRMSSSSGVDCGVSRLAYT